MNVVAQHLSRMEMRNKGFAQESVLQNIVGGEKMENRENVLGYTLAVMMAEELLNKGIISKEEYGKIELKYCEKYCINLSSIFRKIAG